MDDTRHQRRVPAVRRSKERGADAELAGERMLRAPEVAKARIEPGALLLDVRVIGDELPVAEQRVQRHGFGVDRLRVAEERRLHVTRVENAEDRERVPARATVERERDPSGVTRTMAHDRAEPGGA